MNVLKAVGNFVAKNDRKILTVIGLGCEVWAIVEAFRQAPKFERLAKELKEKQENGEEVDKVEFAKKAIGPALKVIIPAAVSGVAQVANYKRTSDVIKEQADTIQNLSSLLMLAREGKEAYVAQITKDHGPEEAERIEKEVVKQKIEDDIRSGACNEVIITGHGTTKIYDAMSGRYFLSDVNFVESAINELNARLIETYEHNGCVELNDLYDLLDLPRIPVGSEKVWQFKDGLITKRFTTEFDEANQPLVNFYITNKPKYINNDDDEYDTWKRNR